jgi:hypothetical protein
LTFSKILHTLSKPYIHNHKTLEGDKWNAFGDRLNITYKIKEQSFVKDYAYKLVNRNLIITYMDPAKTMKMSSFFTRESVLPKLISPI